MACQSDETIPSTPFQELGIALDVPEGWHAKKMPLENQGTYLIFEKGESHQHEAETLPENEPSAQFIVTILDRQIPLGDYLKFYRAQLEQNIVLSHSDLTFSETKFGEINGQPYQKLEFKTGSGLQASLGEIMVFHCTDRLISLMIQDFVEDQAANAKELALLRKSFRCTN